MNASSPRACVSRFYENFDRGDIEGVVSAFSDELETTDPGMGTVYGLEPFRRYLVSCHTYYDQFDLLTQLGLLGESAA